MTARETSALASALVPPSESDLIERVTRIADVIAGGVQYANRERHLAPEVVEAVADAELFSMLTPQRYGGLGADARTASVVLQEIARYCGSTAWVSMITNGGNFYLTRFPKDAQEEVWLPNSGARVASVTSMSCSFEDRPGGYLVTGRWPYSSGIMHDDWAILGNPEVQALVPASDYTIEQTWDTIGMRGTGSHTAVLDNVFVPDHRVMRFHDVMGYDACTDPALPVTSRLAPLELSILIIAAVVVGLGHTACGLVADIGTKRVMPMAPYPTAADSPVFRSLLGESMMRVETARLHLAETARVLDAAARAADVPGDDMLVRLRAGMAHGVRDVTRSLDDLMYLAGSSSFATASPLQQIWRDANTGARHAVTNAYVTHEWLGHLAVDPAATAFKP